LNIVNFGKNASNVTIDSMLDIKDIDKLAELARIEIPQEEKESLRQEIDAILGYVGEIQKVSADTPKEAKQSQVNVFREDSHPHLPGEFTKELLKSLPRREDDYVKVKKIL